MIKIIKFMYIIHKILIKKPLYDKKSVWSFVQKKQ